MISPMGKQKAKAQARECCRIVGKVGDSQILPEEIRQERLSGTAAPGDTDPSYATASMLSEMIRDALERTCFPTKCLLSVDFLIGDRSSQIFANSARFSKSFGAEVRFP